MLMSVSLGILFALIAGISIAVMAICVRIVTKMGGNSFTAVLVSLFLNVIIIVPIAAIMHYPDYGITLTSLLAFIGAGVAGTLTGRVFYFKGIEKVGASRGDSIKATMPIFATIIAVLVLGESPTLIHLIAIVAVVIGVWIIMWEMLRNKSNDDIIGKTKNLIYPIAAAICFGFEPNFARIGVLEGTPPQVGVSIKVLVALVGFALYFLWKKKLPKISDVVQERGLFKWYIGAGLANTSMMVFYYEAIARAPVTFVAPILQTSPLFVVIMSYLWIQDIERISWRLIVGVLVMIGAAIMITTMA